jgi:hypothetical protein
MAFGGDYRPCGNGSTRPVEDCCLKIVHREEREGREEKSL